jgi:hypothetical protein
MIDRTTKILLAIVAIGLWVNALAPFTRPALADVDYSAQLQSIYHDLHNIYNGTCTNGKIC